MKLYSRQLNSLDELKQEKKMLKDRLKQTESEGFFSLSDILPVSKDGDDGLMSKLTGMLNDADTKELIMSLAGPALGALGNKVEKQTLKKIAKEFLGSYVKWKAIELAYKGVKMLMDKNKDVKK